MIQFNGIFNSRLTVVIQFNKLFNSTDCSIQLKSNLIVCPYFSLSVTKIWNLADYKTFFWLFWGYISLFWQLNFLQYLIFFTKFNSTFYSFVNILTKFNSKIYSFFDFLTKFNSTNYSFLDLFTKFNSTICSFVNIWTQFN